MKNFIILVLILGAVGFGGWKSYEHYQKGPSPESVARDLMKDGAYRQAIEWLEFAREEDPDDMEIVLDLATCYDEIGSLGSAAECYRVAEAYLSRNSFSTVNRHHKKRAEFLLQRDF